MRNRILSATVLACFLGASLAMADVTLTQRKAARADRAEKKAERQKAKAARANAKPGRRGARSERPNSAQSFGGITLVDNSGLQWFMNTDITETATPASAAMSEASYTTTFTHTATTSGGSTTTSSLDDAYDGSYNGLCVSLTGGVGPCTAGGGGGARAPVRSRVSGGGGTYILYNQTGGPPVPDGTCGNRQYIFPTKPAGGVLMQRKVFVPSNDSFARWLNIFTNTTGSPITFNAIIDGDNLGSDDNTVIVTSSNGNAVAEVGDLWVTTFQAYSGNTSSDVRLGHVFQGPGGAVGLAGVTFVNGDDSPFWYYTMTLAPGETKIIMNFGVGQLSNAASAAKSAELASLGSPASLACMSPTEIAQVANFAAQQIVVPTVGPVGLALLGLALAVVGFLVVRRLN